MFGKRTKHDKTDNNRDILIKISRQLEEVTRHLKLSQLSNGILTFPYSEDDIQIALPQAHHDYVQKRILILNTF